MAVEAEGSLSGLALPRQKCTQAPGYALSSASSFSPTRPPLFCSSWAEERPLHKLPATGLLVAFGLGNGWGLAGPTPRLTLIGSRDRPRIVIPWAQSRSVLTRPVLFCLSPVGRSFGEGRGGAHTWREALCCPGTWLHLCPQASCSVQRPSVRLGCLGCSSFPARGTGG